MYPALGALPERRSTDKENTQHTVITSIIMKNPISLVRSLLAISTAAALGLSLAAKAGDEHLTMKGAQHLRHLNSTEQASALKPGDTVAMVCSMCKNVAITRVEKERGRELLTPGTKHECPMCGGIVTSVGQRIDKKDVITHNCSKCGGESAFCCATKHGDGKTKGMEEK